MIIILLMCILGLSNSAQIRVSDNEPPEENYWNTYDSLQYYLDPSVKPSKEEIIVPVSTGPVLGRLIRTQWNRTAYAFLGIPYAEAAEYDLRFRVPQAKRSWHPKIYDGRQVKPACTADPLLTYKTEMGGPVSEDCLNVYVYASQKCIDKGGCAIMAVVHGGKFNFESPAVFPEDVIVDNFASSNRDVITVLLGFRLGSFGWINLGPTLNSTSAPKNLGFHDILAGLRWIQNEIHHFGGDHKRVTLFGHSSGASLVDTLSLSPHAVGLFSQLVIGSASTLLSDSEINKNVNVEASWTVARAAGCAPYSNNKVNQLRPFSDPRFSELSIIDAQRSLYNSTEDFYGPSVDGDILPASNFELLKARPLYPTLMGTVGAESRIARYILLPDNSGANITLLTEYCRHVGYGIWYANKEEVSRACIDRYSQGRDALYLTEDIGLFVPAIMSANALSKKSNKVFYYHYVYTGSPDAFDNRWGLEPEDRPAHSEEYIYVLGLHRAKFSAKDWKIQEVFSKVYADFVNRGDPTPAGATWPVYTADKREYFVIDFPTDEISANSMPGPATHYQSRSNDFWLEIVEKKLAGNHTLVDRFPEGFDTYQLENLSQLLKSHYANKSTHHDKTEYAVAVGYERWTEWMQLRRSNYVMGVRSISFTDDSDNMAPTIDLLDKLHDDMKAESSEQQSTDFIVNLIIVVILVLAFYGLYSIIMGCLSKTRRQPQRTEYIQIK